MGSLEDQVASFWRGEEGGKEGGREGGEGGRAGHVVVFTSRDVGLANGRAFGRVQMLGEKKGAVELTVGRERESVVGYSAFRAC